MAYLTEKNNVLTATDITGYPGNIEVEYDPALSVIRVYQEDAVTTMAALQETPWQIPIEFIGTIDKGNATELVVVSVFWDGVEANIKSYGV